MTSDSDYDSSSQKSSIWIYWVAGFCFTPVNGLIAYNQIIGRGPLCMGYSKTNPLGKTPLTLFGESRWTQCIVVDMFCALVASRNGLGSLKIRLLGLDPIRFKGSAIETKPTIFVWCQWAPCFCDTTWGAPKSKALIVCDTGVLLVWADLETPLNLGSSFLLMLPVNLWRVTCVPFMFLGQLHDTNLKISRLLC